MTLSKELDLNILDSNPMVLRIVGWFKPVVIFTTIISMVLSHLLLVLLLFESIHSIKIFQFLSVFEEYILYNSFTIFGIMVSIFAHEIGHIISTNYEGNKTTEIGVLTIKYIPIPFGAYIKDTSTEPNKFVSGAGLFVNMCIAVITLVLGALTGIHSFYTISILNVALILFNALILPMTDGLEFIFAITKNTKIFQFGPIFVSALIVFTVSSFLYPLLISVSIFIVFLILLFIVFKL